MKTPKTNLVSTLVVWEQMHDALRAITRTEHYNREFDYECGRVISVKHEKYHINYIEEDGEKFKEYTYKNIFSITVPVKIPLDSNEVQRYIDMSYNFLLECRELEKPKFTDFFDKLKELEKLPTEDDFAEYPKIVGKIELP